MPVTEPKYIFKPKRILTIQVDDNYTIHYEVKGIEDAVEKAKEGVLEIYKYIRGVKC